MTSSEVKAVKAFINSLGQQDAKRIVDMVNLRWHATMNYSTSSQMEIYDTFMALIDELAAKVPSGQMTVDNKDF